MKLLSFGEIIWDVFGDNAALGGAPLNFAAHAALQGCDAHLASAVGDDGLGARALEEIAALGVGHELVSVVSDSPTGQCVVTLDGRGVPSYDILRNVAYDRIALPEHADGDFDVIAFGTLALRDGHNRAELERFLSGSSFTEIYTDLNIRPPFYSRESIELCLSSATIAKISDEELPTVTETLLGRRLEPAEAVRALSERYRQLKLLLITCGAEGAFCYDCADGQTYTCPASPATVVSTVGAGDSYGATFIVNYLKTGDVMHSMQLASRVSAFVVSNRGAIPEGTAEFIRTLVDD